MAQITLGGKPCDTNGNLPELGSTPADYSFTKTDMSEAKISEYRGRKVILNIFPSVDTGVCAASIRKFNQEASQRPETAILCISMDLPFAQKRFCGAEGIENVETMSNFRDGGAFATGYGVRIVDGGFAGLNARSIVVLDEDGKVLYTELVPETGQEPNYEAALAALG